MQYGHIHERNAKKEMESVKISQCGLFVDELSFSGATPDGFIGTLGSIVEIKCLPSCKNFYRNEAILQRKFTFWKTDRNKSTIFEINKKHEYYFQVQGQPQITKKQYCLFAPWT